MAVRSFNGSSDYIYFNPGALIGTMNGASTIAALYKRNNTGNCGIVHITNNSAPTGGSFSVLTSVMNNGTTNTQAIYTGGATNGTATTKIANADGWVLIVITKASGSAIPRIHKYVLSTATMSRENTSAVNSTVAVNSSARVMVGRDEYFNFNNSKYAVVGIWDVQMSDAQVDELKANLKTLDWYNNSAGTPKVLWDFNQDSAATAVTDLTGGGATQDTINGTTVVTDDDPPGWTFGISSGPQSKTISGLLSFGGSLTSFKTTSTSIGEVAFSSVGTPTDRTNHKLYFRARKTSGTPTATLRAQLFEGVTDRSGILETPNLSTSLTTYELPISDANAASITDYNNLSVKFWGFSGTSEVATIEIADVWLQIPQASSIQTKSFSSTLYSFGSNVKRTTHSSTGGISFTGSISRKPLKVISGAINSTGNLKRLLAKKISGVLSFATSLISPKHYPFGSSQKVVDYETGDYSQSTFHQWSGAHRDPNQGYTTANVGISDAYVITNPVAQGTYAWAYETGPHGSNSVANDRAEAFLTQAQAGGTDGQTWWYEWWTRFPGPSQNWASYTGDWNTFTQMNENGGSGRWIGFGVDASTGYGGSPPYIYVNTKSTHYTLTQLQYDHWYHFVVKMKWSTDSTGYIIVWLDDNKVVEDHDQTLPADNPVGVVTFGMYRPGYLDAGQTTPNNYINTVYHDGWQRYSFVPLTQSLSSGLSFVGATVKRTIKSAIVAAVSFTGVITTTKARLKNLSGVLSFTGSRTAIKSFVRSVTGAVSFSGTQSRLEGKFFTGSISFAGTQVRRVGHKLTAALNSASVLTTNLAGRFTQPLASALSFTGAKSVSISHKLAASLPFTGSFIRAITRSINASITFSGAQSRAKAAIKVFTASISFTSSFAKSIGKKISGALSTIGNFIKGLAGIVIPPMCEPVNAILEETSYYAIIAENSTIISIVEGNETVLLDEFASDATIAEFINNPIIADGNEHAVIEELHTSATISECTT